MLTETSEKTSEVLSHQDLNDTLNNFIGTTQYHKFSYVSKLLLTDGVKWLCDKAGAYWLMDLISSYQSKCIKDDMLKEFQIWELTVTKGEGIVKCLRDTDDITFSQIIHYTDFPLPSIKLYCQNGVIMLPSEY